MNKLLIGLIAFFSVQLHTFAQDLQNSEIVKECYIYQKEIARIIKKDGSYFLMRAFFDAKENMFKVQSYDEVFKEDISSSSSMYKGVQKNILFVIKFEPAIVREIGDLMIQGESIHYNDCSSGHPNTDF